MPKKIVIIGAVALGPKVACRLRRLDPEVNITLIDRDNIISYGGCGIPYYVGGDINDLEDLYSTTAHILRDENFFIDTKRVGVKTEVEAIAIDRQKRRVCVRDLKSGEEGELSYDKLVLATGATPVRLPIPGADLPRVFTIANLHHAEEIKNLMKAGKVGKAVVIGGGAVGVEIAEALTDLWGVATTLIEQAPQLLPLSFDETMSQLIERQMEEHGVSLLLNERVEKIEIANEGESYQVYCSAGMLECDLVILATGAKPNTELAREAGISIGRSGGILVDNTLRTSDPDIYAGGDCIEVPHLISGENSPMQLGSLANRQGRIIATNINGGHVHFKGTVGTFCLKVFDMGACSAGLTEAKAKEVGYEPVSAVVSQADHAHFYPDSELIFMVLIADKASRKILGVQGVGSNGNAVKARVDTIAVLLEHGVSVDEICCLETGYAPPFSSAMDVVNNAGNVLDNVLNGLNRSLEIKEFLDRFANKQTTVLDVRGPREASVGLEKYGSQWLHIPQGELAGRAAELSSKVHYSIFCDTGPRAYETQVLLDSLGIANSHIVQGGYAMVKGIDPEFL